MQNGNIDRADPTGSVRVDAVVRPTLGSLILKVLRIFGPHSVKGIHYLLTRENLWGGRSKQISQSLQSLRKNGKVGKDEYRRWAALNDTEATS